MYCIVSNIPTISFLSIYFITHRVYNITNGTSHNMKYYGKKYFYNLNLLNKLKMYFISYLYFF